jgi:23S rRNA (cytosine1962-C5)-methyltransferase
MVPLLERAFIARRALFLQEGTTAFRLVNEAGDGLPGLVVDYYQGFLLAQYFEAQWEKMLPGLGDALQRAAAAVPFAVQGILCKNRTRASAAEEQLRRSEPLGGGCPPAELTVRHLGLYVAVNVYEGQNRGLFCDMRQVREQLTPHYSGRALLNLFCYTGVFSVQALKCGALSALNVDLSRPVLRRARRNYELNGLAVDDRDFWCEDSGRALRALGRAGRRFGMVIFDPPTFSRNKSGTFSVKQDYAEYLRLIDAVLEPGGWALTAINTHGIALSEYVGAHPAHWRAGLEAHEADDFPFAGSPISRFACGARAENILTAVRFARMIRVS